MRDLFLEVGMCIYCGDKSQGLTREHVLPRGLGGNQSPDGLANALVLQNASCSTCQKVTQQIEEECLVNMMGPGRAKLGLRRKDRAPNLTKAYIKRHNGQNEESEVSWEEVPGAIAIPSFHPAPILTGSPVPEFPVCDYKLHVLSPASSMPNDASEVGVSITADSKMFARMLGKIGLGLAVLKLGIKGYVPLVSDLILKGSFRDGLIGGYAGTTHVESSVNSLHKLTLVTNNARPGSFIIAQIRLFAEFNGPTNYVVIGRWL